jgi:hypothetical protein
MIHAYHSSSLRQCAVVAPIVVFVLQIEAVWHTGVVLGGFDARGTNGA